jgi:small GTP-binding protein
MLGDTFTGKTSLVLRFAEGFYRDSARSATVGAFFITKRLTVQGLVCKVQIWDTAGQEQFNKLAPMYYKNAAAAIVCYDVTSPKSFETLKFWIDELQRNVPAGRIVMAMCATKCDLSTLPDTSQAEKLAQATGAMFLTTSAKNDTNVALLFEQVAERVLQFQKQNADLNIPVTLATTAIETPTSLDSHPAHEQPRIATPRETPPATPQNNQLAQEPPQSLMNAKRQRVDSDDPVVDYAESGDTQEEYKRCDTNMLMCGDVFAASEVMEGSTGQSCVIL